MKPADHLDIRIDVTHLVVEHEYPPARVQDRALVAPILAGSLAFVKAIDEAAAAMHALQHEVLPSQGIPVQGVDFGLDAVGDLFQQAAKLRWMSSGRLAVPLVVRGCMGLGGSAARMMEQISS